MYIRALLNQYNDYIFRFLMKYSNTNIHVPYRRMPQVNSLALHTEHYTQTMPRKVIDLGARKVNSHDGLFPLRKLRIRFSIFKFLIKTRPFIYVPTC